MNLAPSLFAALLVVVLLGLGGYYGWKQIVALRRLRSATDLDADERRYTRNQAWRRLVNSVLMLVFAGLLIGAFPLEERIRPVMEQIAAAETEAAKQAVRDANGPLLNGWTYYWITALVLLLVMVGVAMSDLWAIRSYGWQQYQQIMADRRAMIERQVSRMRRERNGHA